MLKLYKYITASLAFAGSLGLLVTGELNPAFMFPGIMIFPGYYRYITGRPPVSRWLVAGIALMEVLVLAFDILFVSSDFLVAIAHMTIVFQALKSFDLREPWDPLQVYFMSILQVIIISELSLSIFVGLFFAVFLVLFMASMIFSHFMKEGTLHEVRFFKPALFITLCSLFLTLILFLSIPRVSGGLWGRKASAGLRSVGFSGSVELGSYGRVLDDPSIVIRAELEGAELPFYWRGRTLDRFDGSRWTNTFLLRKRVHKKSGRFTIKPLRAVEEKNITRQRVILEPLDADVIFGLGEVHSVEAKGWFLYTNDAGSLLLRGKSNRRISYTASSLSDRGNRDVLYINKHLRLPEGMGKVKSLALEITEGLSGDMEKAQALIAYLNSEFSYTLSPARHPEDFSPIEWFLFESKEGFCEHFSTSLALMLRTLDIPSRIVTGFMGGERNELGNYIIVRQRNAHSWVEAGIDGKWARLDPTPVSSVFEESAILLALDNLRMKWYRYVIGFSRYDQISMLSSLSMPALEMPDIRGLKISVSPIWIAGLVAIFAGALVMVLRINAYSRKKSYSTKAYLAFRRDIARRGGNVYDSSTPEEVAGEAIRLKADPGRVFIITWLYLSNRFGKQKLSKSERDLLRDLSRNMFS
jgi:hypothetical protein